MLHTTSKHKTNTKDRTNKWEIFLFLLFGFPETKTGGTNLKGSPKLQDSLESEIRQNRLVN
jgi:hypothetical protein